MLVSTLQETQVKFRETQVFECFRICLHAEKWAKKKPEYRYYVGGKKINNSGNPFDVTIVPFPILSKIVPVLCTVV